MEYSSQHINDPILPSQEEVILARETSRKLAQSIEPEQIISLKIKGKEGELDLPASAVRLLLDVLEQMANGNAVTLTPLHAELSTNQAAALLRVSRPFLIKLLEEGEIPFRKVGRHRRVLAKDVLAYRQSIFEKRSKALDELTDQAQNLNWGYD